MAFTNTVLMRQDGTRVCMLSAHSNDRPYCIRKIDSYDNRFGD